MLVYLINEEQAKQLQSVNDDIACFSPSWNDSINSMYIAEETLNDPLFLKQKAVFDGFEQPLPTADIDIYAWK